MPTFRTTPSANLTGSIRRLIASSRSNLGPLAEVQADAAAAQTARNMSLAEKARAEVEAMHAAQAARNDPATRTEYAAHAAGIDVPEATQLYKAIQGAVEQPLTPNDDEGNVNAPARYQRPENLPDGSERVFRSALASTIANNLATGKTNAAQLAQAGDRINETALTTEAANTEDIPAANRIIAAVAGKVRQPFRVTPQGVVINEESGDVNEGTKLAGATRNLLTARTGTEGARQTELGSRSTRNTAQGNLADSRRAAVDRGETGRGGQRVTPQQVERWASEVARKEWETIPAAQRKGMNYEQHLAKVRERFKSTATNPGAQGEVTEAHEAIAKGADPAKVAKRFKERMGFDLPAAPLNDDEVDQLLEDDEED